MKWWKALGVAAFVGVAATGVAIARAERERRAYTPEQVRDRLHARVAQIREDEGASGQAPPVLVEPAEARTVAGRLRAFAGRVAASPPVATTGRLLGRARQRLSRSDSRG